MRRSTAATAMLPAAPVKPDGRFLYSEGKIGEQGIFFEKGQIA
jgi:hypothetical protein